MTFTTKYDLGEIVFLITDEDQNERMVVNITLFPGGLLYALSFGAQVSSHYEMEMTKTKDIHKQLNIPSNETDKK